MSLTLADFCEDDSDSDDEEYIPPGMHSTSMDISI